MGKLQNYVYNVYEAGRKKAVDASDVSADDFEYSYGKETLTRDEVEKKVKGKQTITKFAAIKPPKPGSNWKEMIEDFKIAPISKKKLIRAFGSGQDFFILGKAGWGKTRTIESVAMAKGYTIMTVYMHHALKEDLSGTDATISDGHGGVSKKRNPPAWVGEMLEWEETHPNTKWLLFLDEMNQADPDVMNSLMPIVLEHTIGPVHFDNMIVGAAGNYETENDSVTNIKEQKPLLSRFRCFVEWEANTEESWNDHFRWAHKEYDSKIGKDVIDEVEKCKNWLSSPRDITSDIYEYVLKGLKNPEMVETEDPALIYDQIYDRCLYDGLTEGERKDKVMIKQLKILAQMIYDTWINGVGNAGSQKRESKKDSNQIPNEIKEDMIKALVAGHFMFWKQKLVDENGEEFEIGDDQTYIVTEDNCIAKIWTPDVYGINAEQYRRLLKEMKASGKKPKFAKESDAEAQAEAKKNGYLFPPECLLASKLYDLKANARKTKRYEEDLGWRSNSANS